MTKEKEEERGCSWPDAEEIIQKEGRLIFACFVGREGQCVACDYYEAVTEQAIPGKEVGFAAVAIDPDDPGCQEVAERLNLEEYPTVIAFKDGKEVERLKVTLDEEQDIKALSDLADRLAKDSPPPCV
jgi:thioredoxin-like negative regulator of GroEL